MQIPAQCSWCLRIRTRCSAPPRKVRANETETRVDRTRITDTLGTPDLRRSLQLVLLKSSAFSNYSHSTGAASPHLSDGFTVPMDRFACMRKRVAIKPRLARFPRTTHSDLRGRLETP